MPPEFEIFWLYWLFTYYCVPCTKGINLIPWKIASYPERIPIVQRIWIIQLYAESFRPNICANICDVNYFKENSRWRYPPHWSVHKDHQKNFEFNIRDVNGKTFMIKSNSYLWKENVKRKSIAWHIPIGNGEWQLPKIWMHFSYFWDFLLSVFYLLVGKEISPDAKF